MQARESRDQIIMTSCLQLQATLLSKCLSFHLSQTELSLLPNPLIQHILQFCSLDLILDTLREESSAAPDQCDDSISTASGENAFGSILDFWMDPLLHNWKMRFKDHFEEEKSLKMQWEREDERILLQASNHLVDEIPHENDCNSTTDCIESSQLLERHYFRKYCSSYFLQCLKSYLQKHYWNENKVNQQQGAVGLEIPWDAYSLRYRFLGENRIEWKERMKKWRYHNVNPIGDSPPADPSLYSIVNSLKSHINSLGLDFTMLQCIQAEEEIIHWYFPHLRTITLYSLHDLEDLEMKTLVQVFQNHASHLGTLRIFQQRWSVDSWTQFIREIFGIQIDGVGDEPHSTETMQWWRKSKRLYLDQMRDEEEISHTNTDVSSNATDIYGDFQMPAMTSGGDDSIADGSDIYGSLDFLNPIHESPLKRRRIESPSPEKPPVVPIVSLKHIELCGFYLNAKLCSLWAEIILQMTSLEIVVCALNNLGEDGSGRIMDSILKLPHLLELHFTENLISSSTMDAIALGLTESKQWMDLQVLDFSNTLINSEGVRKLLTSLTANKQSLQILRLGGNSLGMEIFAELRQFLQHGTASLKELDLSETEIPPEELLGLLADTKCFSLCILKLDRNHCWYQQQFSLSSELKLTHLSLSHTNFSLTTPIVESLTRNEYLTALDLSGNKLSDSCIPFLEPLLWKWKETGQFSLSLVGNQLTDHFAEWLLSQVDQMSIATSAERKLTSLHLFKLIDLSSNFFSAPLVEKLRKKRPIFCSKLLVHSQYSDGTKRPSEHTTAT